MPKSKDILDFNELSKAFDADIEDVMDAFNFGDSEEIETRIIKPPKSKDKTGKWINAKATAAKIPIEKGCSYFGIIDGSFIFGDLLEAILTRQKLRAFRIDIQTLSLSQENIDSLATLLLRGYVKNLNLIISDYFYVHERKGLIPYIYENLDIDNRFQLAVAGTHLKMISAKLTNGIDLVIHGSANLRSSGNIEQIAISDNPEVYEFITEINDKILNKYKTINKSIRRNILWQVLNKVQVDQVEAVEEKAKPMH